MEAQHESSEAARESAHFDPSRTMVTMGRPQFDNAPLGLQTYNPTSDYLRQSEEHSRSAHHHLEAAESLERFEYQSCQGLDPSERAACPLFTAFVDQIVETSSGVRLRLKQGAPEARLVALMQCHLAYAKAHGFENVSCPSTSAASPSPPFRSTGSRFAPRAPQSPRRCGSRPESCSGRSLRRTRSAPPRLRPSRSEAHCRRSSRPLRCRAHATGVLGRRGASWNGRPWGASDRVPLGRRSQPRRCQCPPSK